jgi:hypothetical protein
VCVREKVSFVCHASLSLSGFSFHQSMTHTHTHTHTSACIHSHTGNALVSLISLLHLSRSEGQVLLLGIIVISTVWYLYIARSYVYRSAKSQLV